MPRLKLALIIPFSVLLVACSEEKTSYPVYQVELKDFEVTVPAFGELESEQAELITAPGRQPMTIAWLAEENSFVKKGDIVARFDPDKLIQDSRDQELEMLLLAQDIAKSQAQQKQQLSDIDAEQHLVGEEFIFTDKFAIDDVRLYSKLEIIDTMQNRDFLTAKDTFLEWKEGSIDRQTKSAIDVLNIRQSGHKNKYDQHQAALNQLNVVAPYDGLLVYEKNWRGEKASIGQTVFPGATLAKLPNLNKLQAKLYVLANEAINLEEGQTVDVTLDALPEQSIAGTITKVSGFPRSIERRSPIKYYELTANIETTPNLTLQPGKKLSATIMVQPMEKQLVVPIQAIHHKEGENFVYLMSNGSFSKKVVKTGEKNLYFVVIEEGLAQGDTISLSIPENVS
ncbi:HlyD family efflux transporter periplasmic adaptor subunit [Alteromonadaceae bacterium M269]|nr:HlyD family efflux transporter periplasmic adaptor subunit [Alteromonadaceae bacterium M269]